MSAGRSEIRPDAPQARVSVQRARKMQMLESFAGMINGAEAVLVATYDGLNVAQVTQLRCAAADSGVRLRVVKNTIARRALSAHGTFAGLARELRGPLIYAAGTSAPAVARVLHEFSASNDRLVVRGGVLNGAALSSARIAELAALPGREALLAMLAGVLRAPVAGLAAVLGAVPTKLVRVLAALRERKGAGGADSCQPAAGV